MSVKGTPEKSNKNGKILVKVKFRKTFILSREQWKLIPIKFIEEGTLWEFPKKIPKIFQGR